MCHGPLACSRLSFLVGPAVQKDLVAKRREYLFTPPRWLQIVILPAVADKRDVPVAFLLSNILVLTLPAAAVVFLAPESSLLGAAYMMANYVLLFPRFVVSLLHITEHRRLFKPDHFVLNSVASLLLTPLFGIPSGVYRLHHRIMHHVEDNGAPRDLSSTEPYQRNSIPHFLMYWVRHALLAWLELPIYAARCGRMALAAQVLGAEVAYILALSALYIFKPTATFWVFILPYFVSTLLMMFGNWCQHMFVNPDCPRSAYGMAYNCVATADNSMTFNDGYHILHHLNSNTHWSELPARFMRLLEQHANTKALVIEGWGVIDVGLAIFAGDYNAVVDRMLMPYTKPTDPATRAAAIHMLQERLKPVKMPAGGSKKVH